jgi:hypothetical protein
METMNAEEADPDTKNRMWLKLTLQKLSHRVGVNFIVFVRAATLLAR